jgi:hypothetical protein
MKNQNARGQQQLIVVESKISSLVFNKEIHPCGRRYKQWNKTEQAIMVI